MNNDIETTSKQLLREAKEASRALLTTTDADRSAAIVRLSELVIANKNMLLEANARDLARMEPDNPLYDRLRLTEERLDEIAGALAHVASLPTPVGEVTEERVLPNGIELRRVRFPYGVVGVIYEARPNVTYDVFALCLKTANACALKGGSDADCSNRAAISLIHRALQETGLPEQAAVLLPPGHEATQIMLQAEGVVDLCIPRGGRRLIDMVRHTATVPVIETGAGVVHLYFHCAGDVALGQKVIENSKTRRVSVCNALDSLLIDASRLSDLGELVAPLAAKSVTIYADAQAFEALSGHYPSELLNRATDEMADREWMDYKMGVFTVGGLDDALRHIALHGSGHSESIVTEDAAAAQRFQQSADAAAVYVNLPTSFTDGAQFGLGAEIGISTQKLGPRGPMGLTALTTERYLLNGHGQTRP